MRRASLVALVLFALAPAVARAQTISPRRSPFPPPGTVPFAPPPKAPPETANDLRGRFGTDVATRLLRSSDDEERLRGIERAAASGTPDGIALLVQSADPTGLRSDARAWLALARALSPFAGQAQVRTALLGLVTGGGATGGRGVRRGAPTPGAEDADQRVMLARETAAMGLAASGAPLAIDGLALVARSPGPGQQAALHALASTPPATNLATRGAVGLTPALIELFGSLGDLRALDAIRDAARSTDSATRAAALVALGELGDERGLALARAALTDRDPRIRAAAAAAIVALGAPDGASAVEKLFADDATVGAGVALAERVESPAIVKALTLRAVDAEDPELRARAIGALGTCRAVDAAETLGALLRDPLVAGDAAHALSTSPASAAKVVVARAAQDPKLARLALRVYTVRALERGERDGALDDALTRASRSNDPVTRAVGVFARVALGDADLARALDDRDPRVRRAAAAGALAGHAPHALEILLDRLPQETDAATRIVLAAGLLGGDPDARTTTLFLKERATAGEADAPLAAMAFAARVETPRDATVASWLGSPDAIVRAHVARGLGASQAPDAVGLLASAYEAEIDPLVRRQIVLALATRRGGDALAPLRLRTLRTAASLDPDGVTRFTAAGALAGGAPPAPPRSDEVAWMRVVGRPGAAPPPGMVGRLLRADGLAVPVAFDDDGYALVPGTPAGTGRLVLAPRLPSYDLGAR